MLLAYLYQNDATKLEEIYRKALEYQNINMDAWYGLIDAYKKNPNKTPENYMDLAKELADSMYYFPLPMEHHMPLLLPTIKRRVFKKEHRLITLIQQLISLVLLELWLIIF